MRGPLSEATQRQQEKNSAATTNLGASNRAQSDYLTFIGNPSVGHRVLQFGASYIRLRSHSAGVGLSDIHATRSESASAATA